MDHSGDLIHNVMTSYTDEYPPVYCQIEQELGRSHQRYGKIWSLGGDFWWFLSQQGRFISVQVEIEDARNGQSSPWHLENVGWTDSFGHFWLHNKLQRGLVIRRGWRYRLRKLWNDATRSFA